VVSVAGSGVPGVPLGPASDGRGGCGASDTGIPENPVLGGTGFYGRTGCGASKTAVSVTAVSCGIAGNPQDPLGGIAGIPPKLSRFRLPRYLAGFLESRQIPSTNPAKKGRFAGPEM
jgi:hypothetical protein